MYVSVTHGASGDAIPVHAESMALTITTTHQRRLRRGYAATPTPEMAAFPSPAMAATAVTAVARSRYSFGSRMVPRLWQE